MEEMFTQFSSLGVCGILSYKLFTTFLSEKKEDKEAYKNELKYLRDLYREELSQDRLMYQESIRMIVDKLDNLEQDIVHIKRSMDLGD